jgi:hypothetical protein
MVVIRHIAARRYQGVVAYLKIFNGIQSGAATDKHPLPDVQSAIGALYLDRYISFETRESADPDASLIDYKQTGTNTNSRTVPDAIQPHPSHPSQRQGGFHAC